MPRDYDWVLESPIDYPLSVDRNFGPKYDDELGDLYRIIRTPPNIDTETYPDRDSREIEEWERTVDLATYQFDSVTEEINQDKDSAEKMFDTGELLVYHLLDDFGDFHANYYDFFFSERSYTEVDELRDSYQEAYDAIEDFDEDDSLGGSAGGGDSGGLGGRAGGGDIGGLGGEL